MRLGGTIGQYFVKTRAAGRREPLRTVAELAEMHGISEKEFAKMLQAPDAPEPVFDFRRVKVANKTRWYLPSEISRWMKQRAVK